MKNKTILLIVAVVMIVGTIFYLEGTKVKPLEIDESLETGEVENVNNEASNFKGFLYEKAPELRGISGYLNSEEIKISDFKGKVVLIDFWTYTCINCIRTLPFLTSWDEKYKDSGLVIIGVHTPEFEFEKKTENVQDAIEQYDIKYRVVQDNDYLTWRAFKNQYWPRKYLIDSDGFIRYDHIGEGGYEETENKIQELLAEIGQSVDLQVTQDDSFGRFVTTPELYAGYNFALPRGQNVGNPGGLQPDEIKEYALPNEIEKDKIYLGGDWKSNPDDLEFAGTSNGIVRLDFKAKSVNIVASSVNAGDSLIESKEVEVLINGEYIGKEQAGSDVRFDENKAFIQIDSPRLYNIVSGVYGDYSLELKFSKGVTFNAFTFG